MGSWFFAGALTASVLVGEVPASASSSVVVRTIRIGDLTTAVSSDGTHVWVVGGSEVTEVSASTGAIIRTIRVCCAEAVSSDFTHVWLTNLFGNTVTELSASTGAVIRTVGVGDEPHGVSSDGMHVWVANIRSNTVTELSASTGAVIRTVGVGNSPPESRRMARTSG